MTTETIITIAIFGLTDLSALAGLYIAVIVKLTRIENDLSWIKKSCPKCQPISEEHTP